MEVVWSSYYLPSKAVVVVIACLSASTLTYDRGQLVSCTYLLDVMPLMIEVFY